MAKLRNRPTWEELRQYGALTTISGQEFVYIKLIREIVAVVLAKGLHAEIPQNLANKEFWTKEDYERLQISEIRFESRLGDPDELDDEVIKVIKANPAK